MRCGKEDYNSWSPSQYFITNPLRIADESSQQISLEVYPNPAEDITTIHFTLPASSHVSVKVYDVSGKAIATLIDQEMEQGEHSLQLNTAQFSKGIYTVRMISDDGIQNQKLIVQ